MDLRGNELIAMADEAERPTRWWLGWIVAFVILAGVGGIGQGIGFLALGKPDHDDVRYQYIEGFMFGATVLGLWAWLRFKERRPLSSLGFRGPRAITRFLLGVLAGSTMITVVVLVLLATGDYDTGMSDHTRTGTGAVLLLLPLAALFVVQASTEESLTRGYMLQVAGRQLPGWAAILGASVFFAVVHLDFHPLTLTNLILFALFASFLALAQRSLWLVCGIHASWNFAMGNLYGVPVSGNPEAVSLLGIGPAPASSSTLTGGDFGPEGGIVATAVWLCAAIASYLYYRRSVRRVGSSSGVAELASNA